MSCFDQVRKGSTRTRQDESRDLIRSASGKALKDGAVFGIDRMMSTPSRLGLTAHERARHHHDFLVGEADLATFANRGEYRLQADRAHETGHDEIRGLDCDGLEPGLPRHDLDPTRDFARRERVTDRRDLLGIGDRHDPRLKRSRLFDQSFDTPAGCDRHDVKTVGMSRDHVERLFTDTPGAPQDG